MPDTGEYGVGINSMPKYVVSMTLQEVKWNNSKLIAKDLSEELSSLKQQAGQDILIFGSGSLVNTLMRLDLIDEYRLMVFPVVVGSGTCLFQTGIEKMSLKLTESKTFSSGVVVLSYQPERTAFKWQKQS